MNLIDYFQRLGIITLLLLTCDVYSQADFSRPEYTVETWYRGFRTMNKTLIQSTFFEYGDISVNKPLDVDFIIVKIDTLTKEIIEERQSPALKQGDVEVIVDEDSFIKKWFLLRKTGNDWKIVGYSHVPDENHPAEPHDEFLYFHPIEKQPNFDDYFVQFDTLRIKLNELDLFINGFAYAVEAQDSLLIEFITFSVEIHAKRCVELYFKKAFMFDLEKEISYRPDYMGNLPFEHVEPVSISAGDSLKFGFLFNKFKLKKSYDTEFPIELSLGQYRLCHSDTLKKFGTIRFNASL